MPTDKPIRLLIDGRIAVVATGTSVAAALAMHGSGITRKSARGALRAPVCGMGVCQECRVTIDGIPHRLACQTLCSEGMRVESAALGERV